MSNIERYAKSVPALIGKRERREGLIGVSVIACKQRVVFFVTLPGCLNSKRKRFDSALDAANYYNETVRENFGDHAVTCCPMAALKLEKRYASQLGTRTRQRLS